MKTKNSIMSNTNSLASTHPELVHQWHPTKNGNLTPHQITWGSNKKVWWKCNKGEDHEWESSPAARTTARTRCPCCCNRKIVLSNCLAITHPELASQWHPIKNEKLTPYDIVAGSAIKIWWKCPIADDHEWLMNCVYRLKNGCPYCSRKKAAGSTCLLATHPIIAAQLHPTKNGLVTATNILAGYNKKVWWKCPIADDHEWQQTPHGRTGQELGCPFCSNRKVSVSNSLAKIYPELADQWHPTKNGRLTPYDITAGGSRRKYWWLCKHGHEWMTSMHARTSGCGCPICKESKGEKRVAIHLLESNIRYIRQYKFEDCKNKYKLPFDFYLPDHKILIEYQGKQHYSYHECFGTLIPEKLDRIQHNDKIKKQWCNKNNIPLLEIPYWNYDNIEEVIDKFLEANG